MNSPSRATPARSFWSGSSSRRKRTRGRSPAMIRDLSHAARDWWRDVRESGRRHFFYPTIDHKGELTPPPAAWFSAFGQLLRSRHPKMIQQLYSSRSALPTVSARTCEFFTLEDYGTNYARLAELLGYPGKLPSVCEMEFLLRAKSQQRAEVGSVATSDYLFLIALVTILAPRRVLEIGTLTGFSAAIIAAGLKCSNEGEDGCRLDTIDLRAHSSVDQTKPTGFIIAESFPELASIVHLHSPHDSTLVSQLARREEIGLVFIDADHRHPSPLLDLLRTFPFVKKRSWIVLHDIRLGTIASQATKEGRPLPWGTTYGAEWLFQAWPFLKISGGNIGAV